MGAYEGFAKLIISVVSLVLLGLTVAGIVLALKVAYRSHGDRYHPAGILASILPLGIGTFLIGFVVRDAGGAHDPVLLVFQIAGTVFLALGVTTATIIAARYGAGRLGAILRWPVVHAGVFVIALGLTWLAILAIMQHRAAAVAEVAREVARLRAAVGFDANIQMLQANLGEVQRVAGDALRDSGELQEHYGTYHRLMSDGKLRVLAAPGPFSPSGAGLALLATAEFARRSVPLTIHIADGPRLEVYDVKIDPGKGALHLELEYPLHSWSRREAAETVTEDVKLTIDKVLYGATAETKLRAACVTAPPFPVTSAGEVVVWIFGHVTGVTGVPGLRPIVVLRDPPRRRTAAPLYDGYPGRIGQGPFVLAAILMSPRPGEKRLSLLLRGGWRSNEVAFSVSVGPESTPTGPEDLRLDFPWRGFARQHHCPRLGAEIVSRNTWTDEAATAWDAPWVDPALLNLCPEPPRPQEVCLPGGVALSPVGATFDVGYETLLDGRMRRAVATDRLDPNVYLFWLYERAPAGSSGIDWADSLKVVQDSAFRRHARRQVAASEWIHWFLLEPSDLALGTEISLRIPLPEAYGRYESPTIRRGYREFLEFTVARPLPRVRRAAIPVIVEERASLDHSLPAALAFSSSGRTLVTAVGDSDGTVTLWNTVSAKEQTALRTGIRYIKNVALAPDGPSLVVIEWKGGTVAGTDETIIHFWDVEARQERGTLRKPGFSHGVAFSPDGQTVAVGGWLVDLARHQRRATLQAPAVESSFEAMVFSPDGGVLASAEAFNVVLWQVSDGQHLGMLRDEAPIPNWALSGSGWALPQALAFSPDGSVIAAAYRGNIVLWDVARRTVRRTLRWHEGDVTALAFSPDGRWLVSGSGGVGTIKLWDVATGLEVAVVGWNFGPGRRGRSMVRAVAFSPNGALIVASHYSTELWRVIVP